MDCLGEFKRSKQLLLNIFTKSEIHLVLATIYCGIALLLINIVVMFCVTTLTTTYEYHCFKLINLRTKSFLHIMPNL